MFLMDTNTLKLIGNIIAFFGMGLFFLSAVLKTTGKILFTQSISHAVNILSEVCTGQYSATIGEATNIVRNGFILGKKNTRLVSIILIILSTVIGALVNVYLTPKELQLIGYIPVVTSFIYSIVVLIPNVRVEYTKGAMIFSTICFGIYSILSENYVMGIGNFIICATTIASLAMMIYSNKKSKNSEATSNDSNLNNDSEE